MQRTNIVPKPEDEAVNLIREIRQEMAEWFDAVERRFDLIDKRLQEVISEYGKSRAIIEQRKQPVK
jgi:3-dehydroquinate dehydratase